jgi:hypothetical protein
VTTVELMTVVWLTTPGQPRWWLPGMIGAAAGYGVLAKGPVALALPACAALAGAPFVWPARGWRLVLRDIAIASVAMLMVAGTLVSRDDRTAWPLVHSGSRLAPECRPVRGHPIRAPRAAMVLRSSHAGGSLPVERVRSRRHRARLTHDRSRTGVLRLYMTGASLTTFAFYSVSASKLPHYALAVVPPLAIVIGLRLDEVLGREPGIRWSCRLTTALLACTAVALGATPWLLDRLFTARQLPGGAPGRDGEAVRLLALAVWPCAVLLALGAFAMWRLRGSLQVISIVTIGMAWPVLFVVSSHGLFRMAYPWERFGREIRGMPGGVWMIGPRAPSLTFHAARPVVRLTQAELGEHLPQMSEGWIVTDGNWLLRSLDSPAVGNPRIEVVDDTGPMVLVRACPTVCRD